MDNLIVLCLIFVISLAILVKGSDFFTEAAEKIGLFMGLSPFIVGVTIVGVGTSMPELISSIISVFQDSSEIVIANVAGSNIANIFLIVGTASIVSREAMRITYNLVSVDLPLFVGSSFLLALAVWDNHFSIGEALLFILAYLMYLFYTIKDSAENSPALEVNNEDESQSSLNNLDIDELPAIEKTPSFLIKQIIVAIISSFVIYLGANYTIESLIKISEIVNIGKEIIAVSAVAVGTSLPEFIVSVNAALKGKAELSVGNVVGSNIFNAFIVMGIPGLIGKLTIPDTVILSAIPVLIAGTLLLFFATQDNKLTKWEGWLFIIFYGWFIGDTFRLL